MVERTTRGVILMADDEVILRNLVRTVLQNDGYAVLVAADGSEAVELSRTHQGPIDLLLTDVEMPHVDGISAYRQITAERPDIKVIFISGQKSSQLELPPSVPFIAKPFWPDTLRAKVHEILAGTAPKNNFGR